MNRFLQKAQLATAESKHIEFKREFDPSSAEAKCELVKDIVALANSGGGVVVFGVEDGGGRSSVDCSHLASLDLAILTNLIEKYTNYQFHQFELHNIARSVSSHTCVLVGDVEYPLIFTKPGTYAAAEGKQKTAFAQGTVYFRHGAKSEPGRRDDLAEWHKRALARARKGWLGNIRKVVHAPPASSVILGTAAEIVPIGLGEISDDLNAPKFVPARAEALFPIARRSFSRRSMPG